MRRIFPFVSLAILLTGCSFLGNGGLSLDTYDVAMDGTSASIVTLSNGGYAGSEWRVDVDEPWLAATPSHGTLDGFGSVRVALTVDRAYRLADTGLRLERSPGSYDAEVRLSSPAGDLRVHVSLHVGDEPSTDACTYTPATAAMATVEQPAWEPPAPPLPSEPTHVIVKLRDEAGSVATSPHPAAGEAGALALLDPAAGPGKGLRLIRVPPDERAADLAARLERDPLVAWAEPDRPLFPQQAAGDGIPNDPDLPRQWWACRFGLPAAWTVSNGASAETGALPRNTVAVIDSGVDLSHPDLAPRLLPGYDFCPLAYASSGSACREVAPEPGGGHGGDLHGTHVAGIAAAAGDDGMGIAGVAWGGTRILPVKVFDDAGSVTSESTVACGIYWAIGSTDPSELCGADPNPNPAAILNLSLGGPGSSATLDAAIADAAARGVLVFAATGNSSSLGSHQGIFMPANAPDAVAVGAVNSNFERSHFSRFDALGGRSPDLMAPGGFLLADGASIFSTIPGGYGMLAGTSMATPFAAGVAALVWAAEPALGPDEVLSRLKAAAYFDTGWTSSEYGAGVVCADAALGLATRCGTTVPGAF